MNIIIVTVIIIFFEICLVTFHQLIQFNSIQYLTSRILILKSEMMNNDGREGGTWTSKFISILNSNNTTNKSSRLQDLDFQNFLTIVKNESIENMYNQVNIFLVINRIITSNV